jgi:predicted ATPase/transcriptional regulator with GAF, ATPase, and Fis domain
LIIPGYETTEELYCTEWFTFHRGRCTKDHQPVLLKIPRKRHLRAPEVELLKREFELLSKLAIPGIPRVYELVRKDGDCCLVLKDQDGRPLGEHLALYRLRLESFFKLAIPLCKILAELHRQALICRGLNPHSILVEPATGEVCLTDLSLASRDSEEPPVSLPLHSMRSLLPYMSPEQTGRMNRATDYRTDFYSLGVVFYEMLTGTLSFQSEDTLELIHGHIAKTPRPPAELDRKIPEPLSHIVMKLLAKTAEERYQSALGIRQDLEYCERELAAHASVTPFSLGQRDVSDRFVIPQKLYGREPEVDALLRAFDHTCQGPSAMMLVAGYSGIGKTSLIQELYKPIVRHKGYFISGKFDQVGRNIPFGALIQAFCGLLQQLLTESKDRLNLWRARLSEALGATGGVLAEVIPEIELVMGKQPPPPVLGPAEALNRFQLVFQNFVGALARQEHPLVVFLDDLQWADAATLSLLQPLLTSPEIRFLFLMGAYRDNEVDAGHPLARTLNNLGPSGAQLHRLFLSPLPLSDLTLFIRDTLHGELSDAEPLARLVLEKTGGNPFFVIQFLRALKEEGFLAFDYEQVRWAYRIEAIRSAAMTDNVIDLMTWKIRGLSPKSQRALTLAACIGNPFDLNSLAVVSQQSPEAAGDDLKEALREGLVLPVPLPYDAFESQSPDGAAAAILPYAFLHDRVQQAAYALIPDEGKQLVHLAVGRLLLGRSNPGTADEKIFDIVHHLNRGSGMISDDNERLSVAQLNLKAGQKAKSSTAYEAALSYLKAGLGLLADEQWDSNNPLMFTLHIEAAECEYLCGHFDEAERYFDLLLGRARTRLDKAQVYNLRIIRYENMSLYADAVRSGMEALALFGVSFPDSAEEKEAALETELGAIQTLLGNRTIDSLIGLPVMEHLETRAVMKLLTSLWAPAYIVGDQVLTRLISATMVRISLGYGNTEESAYGYVTHAITVGPVRGDYRSAYDWGELALSVNERLNDPKQRAKVHQQFHAHVNLWRRPLQTCIPHAREACRSGLETGDFTYAGYGVFTESWPALLTSRDLDRFVRDYSPSLALLERIRMTGLVAAQKVILNWARALQGLTRDRLSLTDENFDEDAYFQTYGPQPFFMTFFSVAKLYLRVIFEEYGKALEAVRNARQVVHALDGTIWPVLLDFLSGLTFAALYRKNGQEEQPSYTAELQRLQESLRVRAENCPENFGCYSLLLSAELERIRGHESEAMGAYEGAIRSAQQAESLQNEALAHELYARFWRDRGNEDIWSLYLGRARTGYREWGAAAKAQHLQNQYPALLPEQNTVSGQWPVASGKYQRATDDEPLTLESTPLDIATVTKAARAIAVEIELEELLRKLMKIAVENAGAQRGLFLQEKEGQLMIQAEGSVDQAVSVLQAVPLENNGKLSQAVVRYVQKTGETVVLGDALSDDRFSADPYIASTRPKSVLCVPVVHQGKPGGILYLENNLAANAFTPDRAEVMHVLCSQAAISLENARLYREMRQEIARRRQAEEGLRAALAEVETLKNRLHAENVYLQEEIRREHNFEEIVGSSPALLSLLRQVEQVAPTDSTVLIYGETGTGKELIARALHDRSPRRGRPLVKVNCGAISAGLVESELFGHVKGAFTGAIENRSGRFELADGGTLFLDEVSELPHETQVKLLRVLQEQEFEPVGSSRTVRVDVRIIAASNRDLAELAASGRFRVDLFYRLNVFPLTVPPLRERQTDIPQLVMFFLSRFSKKLGRRVDTISQEIMDRLIRYRWPGNIRELQNVIERAVVLSLGPTLALDGELDSVAGGSLAAEAAGASPSLTGRKLMPSPAVHQPPPSAQSSLEEVERRHILTVLAQTGWVIEGPKGAAKVLNLHPNTLRSRMKKLGIERSKREAL